MRKLKTAPEANLPSLSKARLKELIEEAVVDAYTEEEQIVGFLTMIEEHLALPFSVKILGVEVEVEKVDMTLDSQIVAICRRGNTRQKVAILDLPCQYRRQQAQNGLPLIAAGAEGPGERIPVLRFPRKRLSADEKRDGRATFHLHAGGNYRYELHEPLRMGRPESQSEQAARKVF
jgi:hypothetical protein